MQLHLMPEFSKSSSLTQSVYTNFECNLAREFNAPDFLISVL